MHSLKNIACPLCKSDKIFPKGKYYTKHGLMYCKHCRLVFMEKIPAPKELHSHYSDYPYFFPQNVRFSIEKSYEELLVRLEPYRINNCLLDYGCGTGIFLQKAKEKGWQVYGIELSEKALIECHKQNLTVYKTVEELQSFHNIKFDVITMFEVIEHLSEINSVLSSLTHLLRKDGGLFLTTPNFNNPTRWFYKENYHNIEYPEHLLYFTCSSINHHFKRSGYKNLFLQTTGIDFSSKRKINASASEISSLTTNEIILVKSQKSVILNFIKKTINYLLSMFRIGMTIKALYIKK